jgi:hypothetical protein
MVPLPPQGASAALAKEAVDKKKKLLVVFGAEDASSNVDLSNSKKGLAHPARPGLGNNAR